MECLSCDDGESKKHDEQAQDHHYYVNRFADPFPATPVRIKENGLGHSLLAVLLSVALIVCFAHRSVNQPSSLSTTPALPSSALLLLYSVVLTMINRHRRWFLATTIVAVLLRLFFVLKMPVIVGDSLVYGDIAKCLLNRHMFGMDKLAGCEPTLIRLPGYPFFLAFTFLIFGQDHYIGAMLFQLVFDVLTCFLVADIARRVFSERAGRSAFVLAAFCPFLMSYVAAPLTECLEIFCITAAIDCAVIALDARLPRWWVLCGAASAGAILLRPDGGLLLGCIGLPLHSIFSAKPRGGANW